MMELERMREVLAEKAMGWHKGARVVWVNTEEAWQECDFSWEPDKDWSQCGMVIEAMRKKRWCWDGSCTDKGSFWCLWWRMIEDDEYARWSGVGDTFPEAVSYVAAKAIEGWER